MGTPFSCTLNEQTNLLIIYFYALQCKKKSYLALNTCIEHFIQCHVPGLSNLILPITQWGESYYYAVTQFPDEETKD